MKFIHAADIHLGCQPDRGFPWSRERSFDILAAFRDLIDACRTERADLLLLSGDIFHRQPAPAELKEAEALFSNIPQIPIVMISGNHDPVRPGSALAEYAWPSHVSFLSSRELSSVSFPDLKTVVHGFSYHTREIREPLYDSLTAPGDGNFHILLAHGGDNVGHRVADVLLVCGAPENLLRGYLACLRNLNHRLVLTGPALCRVRPDIGRGP